MGLKKRGCFITFEGTEGSGKSTQIRVAVSHLRRLGKRVLLLREPGGTRVSEAIRRIILDKSFKKMRPETELLLYLAARAQIVREKILPALQKGWVVVSDRFEDSTLAYQGFGRGLPLVEIERISRWVRGSLKPHLTFLLDIETRTGLKRIARKRDRIEREPFAFHRRVQQGFLRLARRTPRRFVVLDANQSREAVTTKIKQRLNRIFHGR